VIASAIAGFADAVARWIVEAVVGESLLDPQLLRRRPNAHANTTVRWVDLMWAMLSPLRAASRDAKRVAS
jgi:hypothetical protein